MKLINQAASESNKLIFALTISSNSHCPMKQSRTRQKKKDVRHGVSANVNNVKRRKGAIPVRKLKLYLDTSTISHLFADDTPEKMEDTNRFWNDAVSGKFEIFISAVVTDEIENCTEPKRSQMFEKLQQIQFQILSRTNEISQLANEYVAGGVLSEKSFADCLHIAFAVVYNCDIIISWNFKHLVNVKTINKVKVVNAINNYREISIMPPMMLLEEVE